MSIYFASALSLTQLATFDDAWLAGFRQKSGITDEAALQALRDELFTIGQHYRQIIETTPCDLIKRIRFMVLPHCLDDFGRSLLRRELVDYPPELVVIDPSAIHLGGYEFV